MVLRYTTGDFNEQYMPTIGDMYTKDVEVNGAPRHVEIDDTAGQVRPSPPSTPGPTFVATLWGVGLWGATLPALAAAQAGPSGCRGAAW